MRPEQDLPYSDAFSSSANYIESLLRFACENTSLQTLCGGVHVLDFFTNTPDLYASILPESWRAFVADHPIMDFLDLLMREPLEHFTSSPASSWRDGLVPPEHLLEYVKEVRKHLLLRVPTSSQCSRNRAVKPVQKLAWSVSVGMKIKKVHEVGLFASYVDKLATDISTSTKHDITHLIDFGSGQNYLGRALASQPYRRHIVAIERKGHNQDRAKHLDEIAKLRPKQRYMFNGKEKLAARAEPELARTEVKIDPALDGVGNVQYVEHFIHDGDLTDVVQEIETAATADAATTNAMVMSLHSCGNLVHHGLRSLVMNKAVSAVAMVGCCYNLITDRLSPATYKLPELRTSAHPRLERAATACDPHGFPMSDRFCSLSDDGIKLNITARMMAVQAPQNWGVKDSDGFFTRHFYRALLQKLFLDKGVVGPPSAEFVGGSPLGHTSGTPIIIGSLRKGCYVDFVSYVRGALAKLTQDPEKGAMFIEKLQDLSDDEIRGYATRYAHRKKELSVVWSLMAFSAGVVEALIVVDRYLWLKEQEEIQEAWVEPVFDYALSPRNLVVVGIKSTNSA